jgi:putative flippase GtrA
MVIDSSMICKLIKKFRTLILYGIIGSASAALDFLLYTFFVNVLLWHYIVSNCISVLAGITTSFSLNRAYNFKVKDQITKRFSIFLCVGLCGMLLSNLILYFCIDYMQMNKILSKILSIVLVVFFQFLINKYITFRPSR